MQSASAINSDSEDYDWLDDIDENKDVYRLKVVVLDFFICCLTAILFDGEPFLRMSLN